MKAERKAMLCIQLAELGPIQLFEGLRVMRDCVRNGKGVTETLEDFIDKGLAMDEKGSAGRYAGFLGYLDDQGEWDEVLGLLER